MKFGLKGKILSVIIPLLIISFSIVGLLSYGQSKNIITKQSEAQLITKTDYMREKISAFFAQRQTILENENKYVTEVNKKAAGDIELTRQSVKYFLMSQSDSLNEKYGIIDAYIGYSDGTVDCASGWIPEDPTWKSNERPWYKAAIEGKGKQVYTDVYIDYYSNYSSNLNYIIQWIYIYFYRSYCKGY